MTSTLVRPDATLGRPEPTAMPRLLRGLGRDGGTVGLGEHLERWGAMDLRWARQHLGSELEASGLRGHGGAGFPVAAKWRSVARSGRRPIVVVNGAEGEPASAKDALLLARTPHLVLDGAAAAAASIGAGRVLAYVPHHLLEGVQAAAGARRRHRLDPVDIEVREAPEGFISGQESAAVNGLQGRPALPSFIVLRPIRERGVEGRPTLVHNAETLAHVALVARYGAAWFGALGTERAPGTTLLTVTGRPGGPVVQEAALGTPLREVLGLGPDARRRYQAALLGGYGGTWVDIDTLLELELSEEAARRRSATLGPGIVVLLGHDSCPLAEVARVVRYMNGESAGQCGPCVHGLGALDQALQSVAFHAPEHQASVGSITQLCALVEGRGACRHPDGVSRFVTSACAVFASELAAHRRLGPCGRIGAPSALPFGGRPEARHAGRATRPR